MLFLVSTLRERASITNSQQRHFGTKIYHVTIAKGRIIYNSWTSYRPYVRAMCCYLYWQGGSVWIGVWVHGWRASSVLHTLIRVACPLPVVKDVSDWIPVCKPRAIVPSLLSQAKIWHEGIFSLRHCKQLWMMTRVPFPMLHLVLVLTGEVAMHEKKIWCGEVIKERYEFGDHMKKQCPAREPWQNTWVKELTNACKSLAAKSLNEGTLATMHCGLELLRHLIH